LAEAHKGDRPFIDFIAELVLESEKKVMQLLHMPWAVICNDMKFNPNLDSSSSAAKAKKSISELIL